MPNTFKQRTFGQRTYSSRTFGRLLEIGLQVLTRIRGLVDRLLVGARTPLVRTSAYPALSLYVSDPLPKVGQYAGGIVEVQAVSHRCTPAPEITIGLLDNRVTT